MIKTDQGKYKILHIINTLSTGGAEIMLRKLLSRTDRSIFEPAVISLTKMDSIGKQIESFGIPVYSAGIKVGRPDPISIFRLIQLVRTFQPKLIQGWMYHSNLAAQFANFFLPHSVPVLWNIRHSIYNLSFEKRMSAFLIRLGAKLSRKPVKILYNSMVCASQHEALGYDSKNRVVISNGFDTEIFSPSEKERNRIRSELGLPSSALLIGLIGRYHPMKDHATFLQAAAKLTQSHPEAHFLLAGIDVDRHNSELAGLISDLKLTSNTHLLGNRNDTNRIIAGLDILSSSSSHGEGFPNVIGEGMSCGVPCAVTDVAENPWIVGNSGLVVPIKNPQAMANAWKDLIQMGKEGRRSLGVKARKRIVSMFSLGEIVSQYESVYLDILGHSPENASMPQLKAENV